MTSRVLLSISIALVLTACAGGARQGEVARYDLGEVAIDRRDPGLPLRRVAVRSPSWLGTTAMQYRLAYAEAARRETYAESRWVAAPGELLEAELGRHLGTAPVNGCQLSLELDEWVQQFDSPAASRTRIRVRAALRPMHDDRILGRRVFSVEAPATSADARGGVQAANLAVAALARDIHGWLEKLHEESPALAGRCGN